MRVNASESRCRGRAQAHRASELETEVKGQRGTDPEAGPVLPDSGYPRERGCPQLPSPFISAMKQGNNKFMSCYIFGIILESLQNEQAKRLGAFWL